MAVIDCLVTGAGGALGSVVMRALCREHQRVVGLCSEHGPAPEFGELLRANLEDPRTYRDAIAHLAPRAIVHLAAVAKPAEAARDPDRAHAVNAGATAALVGLASELGARFVYASTDMVFDGESAPYVERDATEPGTLYGRTKLEGECYALAYARSVVLRFPLMYGLPPVRREPTFFESMLRAVQAGQPVRLFEDEIRTPLWLEDAARACLRFAASDLGGVWHVAGPESLSRLEMGQRVAAALSCNNATLVATRRADHASDEPRPRDLSLDCTRYLSHFGAAPGHDMHTALARMLSLDPTHPTKLPS